MAKESENKYKEVMQYAGLATQWLVMLLLSVWVGMKIDKYVAYKIPVFTIALPLIALCVSLWNLVRKFNKPKK